MLRRHGVPQWLAVTITLIALLVVIVGLAAAFAISLAELGTILPTYQDRFVALLANLRDWLASLGIGPDQLQAALGSLSFANLAGIVTSLLAALAAAFSNLLSWFSWCCSWALTPARSPGGWPSRAAIGPRW